MPPGGQAEHFWDGETASLTINFATVGIKKKSRFIVRVRLTDCYGDFLNHLKASKGVIGKLVMEKEPSRRMTLAEAGIHSGAVVKMESYTPAKRFDHKISVKLPSGEVINVLVHNSSTIGDLKHKIQDEIGMPVEEQLLEYNSRHLNQDKISVEICGHKKTPLVLKWQPIAKKETVRGTERQNLAVSKSQRHIHEGHSGDNAKPSFPQPSSTSIPQHVDYDGISTGEDTTDGPWSKRKQKMHRKEERHHQPHAQITDSIPSLVKMVPDNQPSERQLEQIASKMVKWESLATHLGIKEPKRYEIERDHREYGRQKVEMLYKWRRQNGSQATWKVLVEICLNVGDRQLAEDIIEIWESTYNVGTPVHGEAPTTSAPRHCH